LSSLILYGPFVFGGKTLFWGTALLQFWPWRRFAAEELHAGRLPLWNPYAGSGVPLLANHQSAVLYPPNVLFWVMPVERAMGLSLALHAILAGLAMYALVRELGVSRLGGTVAALAFSLSGYMVSRGSFLTEVSALPWLPLMWLYTRRLFRRQEMARGVPANLAHVVLLALVVALQFLAGHAQTWFYSLCALLLYALWETLRHLRRTQYPSPNSLPAPSRNSSRVRDSASAQHRPSNSQIPGRPWVASLIPNLLLLVAVVWGVALAAVQFLPTLELSRLAERSKQAGWEMYALQYSMWPWRLITLLLPDFFGNPAQGDYWGYATYWEDAGYVGVLPFVLAVLAVVAWFRLRRQSLGQETDLGQEPDLSLPSRDLSESLLQAAPFFVLLALLSLVLALGRNTPVYMLFYRYVPGLSSFQAPARWLGVYTAAMAVLAGLGVDALHASRRLAIFGRLGVAAGVSVAVTAFLGRAYLPGAMTTFADALIQFAILWGIAMGLLLWGQTVHALKDSRLQYAMWTVAVVLVVAADLIYAGYGLNPAIDDALYASQTQIGAALAADGLQGRTYISEEDREQVLFGHYLDFGDYGPTDIEHWWGLREALHPDLGMVEHLASANTFEPLVEARTRTLLEAVEEMPQPIALRTLGMIHVAYILDPSTEEELEIVHRSPSVTVYRNPHLLPRAYVVYQIHAANSPEQALAILSSPDFDPTAQVILEPPASERASQPAVSPNTEHATGNTEHANRNTEPATVLPSLPNQVTIRAVLPQPGVLVLADTAYPGWCAFVDGQEVEIQRANYALRAVTLDAGEHEVVFRYRPPCLIAGAAFGGAALLAVVLTWIVIVRSRPTTRRLTLHRRTRFPKRRRYEE
jgi:hypothetical protein